MFYTKIKYRFTTFIIFCIIIMGEVMKKEKIFNLLIFAVMFIILFKINVVRADSYCNVDNKEDCNNYYKNHNTDTKCEWKENNGIGTCKLQCSTYSKTSCSGYTVCKWSNNDNKCIYANPNAQAPSAVIHDKKCEDRADEKNCKSDSTCRWSNNKCRSACGGLDKDACRQNSTYCSWVEYSGMCNEKCSNLDKSACIQVTQCEWKNNKCVDYTNASGNSYDSVEYEDQDVENVKSQSQHSNSKPKEVIESDLDYTIYDNYSNEKASCGGNPPLIIVPASIPKVTHLIYIVILIAVPVVLIILGMLDLFKGITAQKEEEIKKGQQIFVKRLIHAAIIFFVLMIVRLLIGFVSDSKSRATRIISCVDCFISGKCQ